MGTRYNAAAILAGMGSAIVSQEDNDLNININADHEGDGENKSEDTGAADFVETPAETEPVQTEEEPTVAEVETNIAEDTSGVPETAELDVNESSGEVTQVADQIEDVNDVAAGLEGLIIQMATISQEGIEITPFLANTLHTQYDFITRKFPKLRVDDAGNSVVPSVESLTVSQEASDGFMSKAVGKLKGAGKAVVQFLKDLWVKIKAMFGSLTASSTLMRNKAKSLQGRKASGKKITLPSTLTSAPFTAASIDAITGLVVSLAVAKFDADALISKGSTALNAVASALSQNKNAGTYLGNFRINSAGEEVPKIVSAEASAQKDVTLSDADIRSIAAAVIKLADAIENYKRSEGLRKNVSDKLIKILEEEVTPEDASRYAKWRTARDLSKSWGRLAAYEGKLISKAVAVGNAANNALAAGSANAGTAVAVVK